MEKKTPEKVLAKTVETGGKKIAADLMKAATPIPAPARTPVIKETPATAAKDAAEVKKPAKTTAKPSPAKDVKTAAIPPAKRGTKTMKKTTGKVTSKTAAKTVKK